MKQLTVLILILSGTIAFAQEPEVLNDFSADGASTFNYDPEIEGITTTNQLFFIADDGKHGEELWRSNGTAVGTQLLKDINPDETDSNIRFMAAIGNTVFFGANDGEHGFELWSTQGTTSSTQMVKDMNPGANGGITGNSVVFNDMLLFSGNAGDKGTELYRTAGTEASTSLVRDINPNISQFSNLPFSSTPNKFTPALDFVYFVANDGEHGNELWKTDGTFGGTSMVKDITEGAFGTGFSILKTAGNTLYFIANDRVHGNELWKSDGTAAGTILIKDITEGENGSIIELLEEINGTFYFTVKESVFRRLWKTDGTEEGTEMVLDEDGDEINIRAFTMYQDQLFFQGNFRLWKTNDTDEGTEQVADVSIEGEFAILNDTLYFVGYEGIGGNGLWKTDGTTEGTVSVKEDITAATYREIDHLTAGSGHVFFIAETDEFGRELWASDGTEEGTFMLIDSAPGEEDGFRSYEDVTFYTVGNKLLFAGFDVAHGRELWSSDGTIEGTALVKDIQTKSEDIQLYSNPVAYNNHTFFTTAAGIWRTDGTAGNTFLVKELTYAFGLNVYKDKLLFTAQSEENNRRIIWTSDGTEAGTAPLFEVTPESGSFFQFQQSFPQINDQLLFPGRDSLGSELWKTDGTVGGTVRVKDINEGNDSGLFSFSTGDYVIVNGMVYFVGSDNLLGNELWKTDGTEAGTVPVSDINPFGSSSPRNFTEINGTIYFSADDGTAGFELWKTDGSTEGTVLVKDIFPGDEDDDGVSNTTFINFQGTLFFAAQDGEHGRELWKSNGTEAGTVMVKDIYPASNNFSRSSNPRNFFVAGNVLYFVAQDSTGIKIWKTDGTEEGTQPFVDLEASSNTKFVDANGSLFFSASDGELGMELWKTDGTPEGSRLVNDIIPGPRESSPTNLSFINNVLYFTALDDIKGRELWALKPFDLQVALAASNTEICAAGDTITFTASATHAGANPEYLWYINEQLVENNNNAIFTTANLSGGDAVKVQVIADEELWVLQDSLFSENIQISFSKLNPKITIAGSLLKASEGTGYRWFLNGELLPDSTQSISASITGSYQVEIMNEKGCSFLSDEVNVVVCESAIPVILTEGFTLTANSAGTYRWFFDGELLTDTTRSIQVSKSGDYRVEVTHADGCAVVSESVTIDLCENFTANIQLADTTLIASKGLSYKWFFNGKPLPDTTQSIAAGESGVYEVVVTDSLGCTARSDTLEVLICTDFTATLTQNGTTLTASNGASFQWFFNGTPLPDDTQTIEPQTSGTFQVEITNTQGCVARSEEVILTVTGIADELLSQQISMYPNPAVSRLTIDSQGQEEIKVFVYCPAGNKVLESVLIPQQSPHEISLHHLPVGLYLVHFIGKEGVIQKKLIKN